MEKIKEKIKKNPVEFWMLIVILIVGAFLRLYRIDQYLTFLGDEGRDVIIVRRLLVYFDPILIGPGTSIGNMYLGPLYYYMMAIPLLIANFSPVGPAVMVAILGVVTIAFVWWVVREWFPTSPGLRGASGLIAAGLYAISPTVIIYSRSSWNPNIMPFFSLLSVYAIWKVYESRGASRGVGCWLLVLGISYAFVLQSHYLGLLLAPTLFLFWILTFRNLKLFRNSTTKSVSLLEIKNFLQKSLIGFLIFAGLMSPLVIFDARHGWRNFSAMKQFISVRQETVSIKPWKSIPNMWPIFEKANIRLLTARNEIVGKIASLTLLFWVGWIIYGWKKINHRSQTAYKMLLTWLAFSLIGLGLYKQAIYDHYFGFMFPVPFLLLGGLAENLLRNKKYKILTYTVFSVLVFINLNKTPISFPPDMQLPRTQVIAKFIDEKSGGERYNIATISERNNRDVYQYFLLLWGSKVVDADPSALEYTITDQLFVVCEMPKEKCDPVHDPSAWITNFGWTKTVDQWEVWGVNIYKLGHTK